MLTPYMYELLLTNNGRNHSELGRHQALAIFLEDYGLQGKNIEKRSCPCLLLGQYIVLKASPMFPYIRKHGLPDVLVHIRLDAQAEHLPR